MNQANPDISSKSTTPRLPLTLAQRLALGTQLTELRVQRNLTQLDVARQALGFEKSHAAVSRLERGLLDEVGSDRLNNLCAFFGTTPQALLAQCDARREDEPATEFLPCDGLTVAPGVGTRLRTLRQAAGLSPKDLTALMGHHKNWKQHLQMWEQDRVAPNPDTLFRIAAKLEVSAAWLITGKRAKPIRPTTAMRVNALQKAHNLTNQDLAHLAGLDVASGRSAVFRVTRGKPVVVETLKAIATALDVPLSWITPPSNEAASETSASDPLRFLAVPEGLSKRSRELLVELAQLLAVGAVDEQEVSAFRAGLMKRVMKDLRKAA